MLSVPCSSSLNYLLHVDQRRHDHRNLTQVTQLNYIAAVCNLSSLLRCCIPTSETSARRRCFAVATDSCMWSSPDDNYPCFEHRPRALPVLHIACVVGTHFRRRRTLSNGNDFRATAEQTIGAIVSRGWRLRLTLIIAVLRGIAGHANSQLRDCTHVKLNLYKLKLAWDFALTVYWHFWKCRYMPKQNRMRVLL